MIGTFQTYLWNTSYELLPYLSTLQKLELEGRILATSAQVVYFSHKNSFEKTAIVRNLQEPACVQQSAGKLVRQKFQSITKWQTR